MIEIIETYCYDCKEITKQQYKGKLADNSHLYICKECGCKNTLTEKEKEDLE